MKKKKNRNVCLCGAVRAEYKKDTVHAAYGFCDSQFQNRSHDNGGLTKYLHTFDKKLVLLTLLIAAKVPPNITNAHDSFVQTAGSSRLTIECGYVFLRFRLCFWSIDDFGFVISEWCACKIKKKLWWWHHPSPFDHTHAWADARSGCRR